MISDVKKSIVIGNLFVDNNSNDKDTTKLSKISQYKSRFRFRFRQKASFYVVTFTFFFNFLFNKIHLPSRQMTSEQRCYDVVLTF